MSNKVSEPALINTNISTVHTYFPPNSCIPSSADITMKRNNKNIKLKIDFIPFINELIKFLRDDQYLLKYHRLVLETGFALLNNINLQWKPA